jgi:hypothetical protein
VYKRKEKLMKVHVVVTVYSGCIQDVDVFVSKEYAETIAQAAKKDLGIIAGHEAESNHDVQVFERVVI